MNKNTGFQREKTGILLEISGLKTVFMNDGQRLPAVDGLDMTLYRGEVMGLVGESGSGKTMTALSVLGLVPPPGKVLEGTILFEGTDICRCGKAEMERIRGGRIGMVFQEPMTALNPVLRVGDQIGEVIAIHADVSKGEVKETVLELLRRVGFTDPERRYFQYPHQLSGGQRQRVLIAMAISCNPSLIIADEPTTALDVATESQIINLLKGLVSEHRSSLLFITHNLHILRRLADRIGIMYAGRLLEISPVEDFYREPLHPYSRGLLESIRGLKGSERRLKAIPGYVPKLAEMPRGCKFHPRCESVMDVCRENEPQIKEKDNGRWVRCYLY